MRSARLSSVPTLTNLTIVSSRNATTETTGGRIDYGFDFKNRGWNGGYGASICSPKGKESDPNTISPGFRQLAGFLATPKLGMARLGTARTHAATVTEHFCNVKVRIHTI